VQQLLCPDSNRDTPLMLLFPSAIGQRPTQNQRSPEIFFPPKAATL
jgi:hypothetical protein